MAEETLATNLDITFENSDKEAVLSARDIIVEFTVRDRVLTAIRNVSLDLYDGETLAIVGESGSGKSVFTKTFTGMLDKNGNISQGQIIGSQITEVIVKHQGVDLIEARKIAVDLMKRVGINNAENRFDEYPFMYSGGMRQRIVIAIALACRPRILICDEPTTALDVTIQAQIIKLIKDLQEEYHFTTVYITHDLGVVANVADKVAVMYAGQIVEYGTVEEVFYDPKHPYTWALLSSMPQLGIKGQDLYAITGTPPSLFEEVVGDAFAPRNPYAMRIDFEEEPPMFAVSSTHLAKTWLLDPRAPKVEKPEVIRNLHERLLETLGEGGTYHG